MADQRRDIDLVLVTGAGASREFGNPNFGGPATLPLMGDWAASLLAKLVTVPSGQGLMGLSPGLDGPEFERRLGRFLKLVEMFPDLEPILEPSLQASGLPGLRGGQLQQWYGQTGHFLQLCVQAVHESLYENFGWDRTLPQKATGAYRQLFQALKLSPAQSLVYATTNYDRLGETAIDRLGWRVDVGERSDYSGPGIAGATTVDVGGLLGAIPRYAPVLHLHGAVGWYRSQQGQVIVAGGTRFDHNFGVPLVMLPDPSKDYEAEPVIQSVWRQFLEALRRAKKVLVLGHSLNDTALLNALRTEIAPAERLAVTVLGSKDQPGKVDKSAEDMFALFREHLPEAKVIALRFDEQLQVPPDEINAWYGSLESAANED